MPHVDLLELPYFEGISMDALVSLVDTMEPRRFAAGQSIMTEGASEPTPLYITTAGRVDIVKKTPAGEQRRFAELPAPTLFGEIELFCQIPPVASAIAVTPVSAFILTRENFERLFNASHPALNRFTLNVARVACHRLAVADEIMARASGDGDLVAAREAVFAALHATQQWPTTTGAFKRPAKL